MPYNFVADRFHIKKLFSRLLREKCTFWRKTAILRFWPRLGVTGNVRCSP